MNENMNENMNKNIYETINVNIDGNKSNKKNKMTKDKTQKGNFGVTLLRTAAIALVFGLVAGVVFTGVTLVGGLAVTHAGAISDKFDFSLGGKSDDKDDKSDSKSDGDSDQLGLKDSGPLEKTAVGQADELVSVSDVVDVVMPSVVAITNTSTVTYRGFFGSKEYESESCGSGVIIDQDEDYIYIVSNNHVVTGAKTLTVEFVDGTSVEAVIQGQDPSDDLAVVKVAISDISKETIEQIKVATVGDSTKVCVGDGAIAIGNALGYGQSVTSGVISALGRSVTVDEGDGYSVINNNLIQTDAAINPGNSGGALLNAAGEVIGINSIKYSDTRVEGIGYAIPMSDALPIIAQMVNGQTAVASTQEVYLGVQGEDTSYGVCVRKVLDHSAAKTAGIMPGDIITAVDGQEVFKMSELKAIISSHKDGDVVTVTYIRRDGDKSETKEVEVTLKPMV